MFFFARILEILQETRHLFDCLCRRNPFIIQVDSETSNSLRASLHSDDNDVEISGRHGMTVATLMPFELDLEFSRGYSVSSSGWQDH